MSRLLKIWAILISICIGRAIGAPQLNFKRTISETSIIECPRQSYTALDAHLAALGAADLVRTTSQYRFPFTLNIPQRDQISGPYSAYPLLKGKVFTGDSYTGRDYVVLNSRFTAVTAVTFQGNTFEGCRVKTLGAQGQSSQSNDGHDQPTPFESEYAIAHSLFFNANDG